MLVGFLAIQLNYRMNRFLDGAQGFFQRYTICAVLNVLVLKNDKKG